MQESFVQYLWQTRSFNQNDLRTSTGEPLEILKVGFLNSNSGPDFFNAQIKIGSTRWAGNVEIHTKSSDWYLHKHELDLAYDKVILHLVWENDRKVYRNNGVEIPTLELKGRVKRSLIKTYNELTASTQLIACESQLDAVDSIHVKMQLSKVLIERLEQKSKRIEQLLRINKGDWESACYQVIAKYFGFKVNALPFELLSTTINYHLVRQYSDDLVNLEALFFGQAGFLENEYQDDYPNDLKARFLHIKRKHQLEPLGRHLWKFLRMRPRNFPTIRLAQFSSVWANNNHLFQNCIQAKSIANLRQMFKVETSEYWKSHHHFDKTIKRNMTMRLGENSINVLLINAILPLKFLYLKSIGQDVDSILDFYESIEPENNRIIRRFDVIGVKAYSAFDSQALLQLKSEYCDLKKCLICKIGNSILKHS